MQERLGYVADRSLQIIEAAYGQELLDMEMKESRAQVSDSPRDAESSKGASSLKDSKQPSWA